MLTRTEEGRIWRLQSSWLSQDKSVSALKEQLGVSELPIEMIHNVEQAARLVAHTPPPDPVVIKMHLSWRAFAVLVAINLVTSMLVILTRFI